VVFLWCSRRDPGQHLFTEREGAEDALIWLHPLS
jgi:hypothetical protein